MAVIGLGRFGTALALELVKSGREVLGIDSDEKLVQANAEELTQVVQANSTDEDALRELGIPDFDSAVVAIGSDLEASILTASLLLQLGVPQVWAKATSVSHGRILQQLGVHHVIFPEMDMGKRVAHMVSGESLDYIQLDEDFVMAKTEVPESFEGKTLSEMQFRSLHGVTVVATKKPNDNYKPSFPETVLNTGDVMIVAGRTKKVEEFCRMGW
ncbi:MAG: TrkA family potassium uptake protein [Actinobacteria bacterium]|nr:TrkA family potassium uptake protein [Actinomycetota bacterium]MSZ17100.1 TrkA family potassium uptake protein [Actinomycetota bacterium]MTA84123.1 TrkA family potassium uptake protein [Actinomycetota bacterium]